MCRLDMKETATIPDAGNLIDQTHITLSLLATFMNPLWTSPSRAIRARQITRLHNKSGAQSTGARSDLTLRVEMKGAPPRRRQRVPTPFHVHTTRLQDITWKGIQCEDSDIGHYCRFSSRRVSLHQKAHSRLSGMEIPCEPANMSGSEALIGCDTLAFPLKPAALRLVLAHESPRDDGLCRRDG